MKRDVNNQSGDLARRSLVGVRAQKKFRTQETPNDSL